MNLDGYDYYDDSTFISDAVKYVQTDPKIVMYASGNKGLDEKTGRIGYEPMGIERDYVCISGTEYVLGYPKLGATQHYAVVYNRKLALETGFYQLDSLGADTDSLCRLAMRGKVLVHKKYPGVWTHHGANASYSLTVQDAAKEIRMLTHIAEALKQYVPSELADKWLAERIREKNKFVLILNLSKLPLKEALQLYIKNFRLNFFSLRESVKLFLRFLHLK